MVIVLVLAKYSLGIVLLLGLEVASGDARRRHKALAQQPLCHPAHPLNRRARANLQSALCFTMVMMVMMMRRRRSRIFAVKCSTQASNRLVCTLHLLTAESLHVWCYCVPCCDNMSYACPPRNAISAVLQNGDGGGAMGMERRRRRQKRVDDEDK